MINQLGNSWAKKLKSRVEKYEFEVGILNDKPHKEPVPNLLFKEPELKNYAGGPVRKTSRIESDKTIGQILIENMKRLNINLLQAPFRDSDSDLMKFTQAFLRFAVDSKKVSIRRVENLLQAVVRNPILKQEYGNNKAGTADAKGFDRHLFDTGQMFKEIRAKAKRV